MGFTLNKPNDSFEKKPAAKKEYAPLPDGVYKVTITESEYEEDDKACRFALELVVDDESSDYNKRKIWPRFIVSSDSYNPKAVEIGSESFAKLTFAAGVYEEGAEYNTFAECSNFAHKLIGQTVYAQTKQSPAKDGDKIFINVQDFWTLDEKHVTGKKMGAVVNKKPGKTPRF
jgi:hypothetical protein